MEREIRGGKVTGGRLEDLSGTSRGLTERVDLRGKDRRRQTPLQEVWEG